MGFGARVQSHKAKLKKETNNDTLRNIQNPGTTEGHRLMKSHFTVIKKCGHKASKQGGIDYLKQTNSVKKTYKKKMSKHELLTMKSIVIVQVH